VHEARLRNVISDTMINFLFKTSCILLLVMLYVIYDTELQCSSVGTAISRGVLFMSIG